MRLQEESVSLLRQFYFEAQTWPFPGSYEKTVPTPSRPCLILCHEQHLPPKSGWQAGRTSCAVSRLFCITWSTGRAR